MELIKPVQAMSPERGERNLILSMIDPSPERRPTVHSVLNSSDSFLNVSTAILELSLLKARKKKQEDDYNRMNPSRECIICGDEFRKMEGVECPDEAKKHFMCRNCFADNVRIQSTTNRKRFLENGSPYRLSYQCDRVLKSSFIF